MTGGNFRRAALVLASFLLVVVFWMTSTRSYYNYHRSKAQLYYRKSSAIIGFPLERLARFPILNSIVFKTIPIQELLHQSILSNFSTPTCSLSSFQQERYQPLLTSSHLNYLICINLINAEEVVPTIINALVEVISSLGTSRFHVSIYENSSKDSSSLQLFFFSKILERLGVGFTIISDEIGEQQVEGSRIDRLAKMRNTVIEPLLNSPPRTFDRVLFLNDIILCSSDILEIMMENESQEADLSCGMDYKELAIKEFAPNYPMIFYDNWVARDNQGLPFYKIEKGGNWALPSDPLQYSTSRTRFEALLPIQVFSCFNGIALFKAALFTSSTSLRFRSHQHTDEQSECYLVCTDIWKSLVPWNTEGIKNEIVFAREDELEARGARIQIVPRSSVAYNIVDYERVRKGNITTVETDLKPSIDWNVFPPKRVASYPYARWNEEVWVAPF